MAKQENVDDFLQNAQIVSNLGETRRARFEALERIRELRDKLVTFNAAQARHVRSLQKKEREIQRSLTTQREKLARDEALLMQIYNVLDQKDNVAFSQV